MLRSKALVPDLIISSSALRAKTTVEIVAEGCKYEGAEFTVECSLYNATPQDYFKLVEKLSDTYIRVLLAGHNPTIEETVETLTRASDAIVLSTCTVAHRSRPIEKLRNLQSETKNKNILKEIIKPKIMPLSNLFY